jgi:hypothetical protein|tara:strand:- start:13931 stop:14248 length:318 start_codon:yes stop_codon:yes gene_type:complete
MLQKGILSSTFGVDVACFKEVWITDYEEDQIVFADISDALVGVGGDANYIAGIDFGGGIVADFDETGSREHDITLKCSFEPMKASFLTRFHTRSGEGDFWIFIGV